MADFLDALRDPEFRANVLKNLRDVGNRSAASFFGGPVDLATMVMRPFGYQVPDRDVVGGSEWLGKQMEQRGIVSEARNPTAEFLGALAIPGAMASQAPRIFAAEQAAVRNAMVPRTMNPQTGALVIPKFRGKLLEDLPEYVDMGGGRMEQFGTDQRLVDIAREVAAKNGVNYTPQTIYAKVDPVRAKRLADAYEAMQNNPADPKVKASYDKMINETMDQYDALRRAGYKFDFMPESGDIYGNPRNAINDLILNKRMSVFPTEQGFGGPSAAVASEANPLLMRIGEKWNGKEVTANDVFRAVHDAFGHAKYGVGFRARGEENAFQSHARMYSKEALPAVTSETRGQNSWVNYGPYGAKNRTANPAETEYAEQKTGVMDPWTYYEGLLK